MLRVPDLLRACRCYAWGADMQCSAGPAAQQRLWPGSGRQRQRGAGVDGH